MGNGADSFDYFGSAGENSTTGYDNSFTRQAFVVSAESSPGTTNYALTPGWSAVQEAWFHFRLGAGGTGHIIYLMDGADPVFRLTSTSGRVHKLEYLSAPATWTQIGSTATLAAITINYDLYFKSGISGEAALFANQVEVISGIADMSYAPDVDNVKLVASHSSNFFSQFVVAEESTIGWRLAQGYMSASGSDTAWTGDYSGVDEADLNDADFINSGSADQVETFVHTTPSLTGYIPRAVCVTARAKRDASGPQSMQLALRSAGTNYFSATKALGLGYSAVQNIWETNPATAADFLTSQISALQPGVKSIT